MMITTDLLNIWQLTLNTSQGKVSSKILTILYTGRLDCKCLFTHLVEDQHYGSTNHVVQRILLDRLRSARVDE